MADTQQGVRQQSARDAAGTADTHDGDLRALFESVATVPAGSTYNEAFMLWLQSVTGSSADNINDLAALYASQQEDTYNWSSVGSLGPPALFDWEPEVAEALPDTATFARASVAQVLTTTDGTTNWYQEAKSGELRLDGLRRVENYVDVALSSFDLTGSTFSDPTLSMGASAADGMTREIAASTSPRANAVFCVTARVKSTTGSDVDFRLSVTHGSVLGYFSPDFTATADYQIFSFTQQFTNVEGGSVIPGVRNEVAGGAKDVDVDWIQLERVQDSSDTFGGLAEFDVEYLNIGVNGVRYFNTTNGNSVDANGLVIETSGTTITGGAFLWEPAATNLAIHSRDFTNAAWIATNITPAQDATGIDGATQASTLTATAANGTILQTITSASSAHTYAVFVARKTGTGTIEMTIDGGTTWVDITSSLSSDITDRFLVTQTLANPSIGFRIVTSGDEIEVDVAQPETTAFATSPIITGGSAETRETDSLTDADWPSEASAVVDTTVSSTIPGGSNDNRQNMLGFGSFSTRLLQIFSGNIAVLSNNGAPAIATASSSYEGERHSYGMSIKTDERIVVDDEDNDATATGGGAPGLGAIHIGSNSAQEGVPGRYHKITVFGNAQTVDELKSILP